MTKLLDCRSRMVAERRVTWGRVGSGGVLPDLKSLEKDLMILLRIVTGVSPSSTCWAMMFSQKGWGEVECGWMVVHGSVCCCFSMRVLPCCLDVVMIMVLVQSWWTVQMKMFLDCFVCFRSRDCRAYRACGPFPAPFLTKVERVEWLAVLR